LLNFLFDPVNAAEARKYSSKPSFKLSAGFFKDFFYYHIHHFKTTNPAYAFEFLWQKSYS